MPTRSLCSFRQSLSDVSYLILYQPDTNPSSAKPHNLSPLSIITKLSLRNVSISFVKDALYSAWSWLSGSKAPVRMYPKLKLNFSERSIS